MGMDFNVNVKVKTSGADVVDNLERQINSLKNETINLRVNLTGDGANFARNIQTQLSSASITASKVGQQIGVNLSNGISNGSKTVTTSIKKVETSFQKLEQASSKLSKLQRSDISSYKGTSGYKQITDNLEKAVELQSRLNIERAKGDGANIDKMNQDLKEMNSLLTKSESLYNNLTKPINTIEATTASNKTLTWLKNNTKASKELGDAFRDLAAKQRSATTQGELQKYNKEFRNLTAIAQNNGLTGNSFTAEFGRAAKQIGEFAAIYGGWQIVGDSIRRAVSELKKMDNILTEISKVSDMTKSQIQDLAQASFDYASTYGKRVTDYLEGVTEMNRSGFYGQQGIDLANTSVLAQAAGDMTADVANSYLLATNAAYKYAGSAEKLNAVLDGQNMITNRNSVNMTDMAEATTQAGSMAAQAGVQIDQLSALVGTAVARTKKDGNEVGTALKALFINLQNTQNAKITGTFDDLGISMTKMVGDSELLKTPIELLAELSEVYNALPEGSTAKANILTNIGGKHHANVLSSILAGYSDYEKMLTDYAQGTGSAAVEAEKSANNWTGSLNKLSNSWTELISNFVQSDQIIGGVNAINMMVQAVDNLVGALTPLGTLTAGAGIFAFFKNLDKLKNHRVSLI